MNAPSSVFGLASALVHHSAASSPPTRDRHAGFIAERLGLGFAALACAPLFLALRGAPTKPEILVFACSLSPLCAAMVAGRTGRLAAAHAVAALGLIGLGLSLWLGVGCGIVCTITWLFAANVEARLADGVFLPRLTSGITAAVLLCILATTSPLESAASQNATITAAFAGLALLYASLIIGRRRKPALQLEANDSEAPTWRAISEAISDVVIAFDAAGWVDRVRSDRGTWLDLPSHALMGTGFFEHVHVADRSTFLAMIADAAESDGTVVATLRFCPNLPCTGTAQDHPQSRRIEMRARRISTDAATGPVMPARVVAVVHEVETRDLQASVASIARRSVEESDQSKDCFLANMSHELRTPLNAIIGFSEMLASHTLRPADIAKQREYATIINQSGQHLLAVVNSILDMSKIRSGTFTIVAEPFDLVPLLDLCCDIVRLHAQEGQIRLVRDYPDRLDAFVGDPRACKQILINLISNAVKFTPAEGQVTVRVRTEAARLVVTVSDTGIGIAAADLARLGDPFFQAGASLNRPFEGTGLGLSVVRGLVGLHGGSIAIESEPGLGTNVEVRLPLDCRATDGERRIETLTRRSPANPARSVPEQRMKQVA